jgi:type I restriction enzyme M protein
MQFEEFAPCLAWWGKRDENGQAWRVKADDLLKYDVHGSLVSVNLDRRNPSANEDLEHIPPEVLVKTIIEKEQKILETISEVRRILEHP